MNQHNESGVVLLLVMVLIAVSISIAYATAKTSAVDVLSARQREHLARAQVLARSGVAIATRALLDDAGGGLQPGAPGEAQTTGAIQSQIEGPDDAWALLGRQPIVLEGGGVLKIHVSDAGSKIGINALLGPDGKRIGAETDSLDKSHTFLDAALEAIVEATPELRQLGLNDEKRGDLADAILDWIDSDDETRIGTPEASHYARADGRPLDRPLISLDELATVPGLEPLLLDALHAYFSPYPLYPTEEGGGGGINPNTAPPHVLALLYHGAMDMRMVDEDQVFHILKVREEGNVFCTGGGSQGGCVDFATEMDIHDVFPPLSYSGSLFHVDVEASYQNARACVHSVIDRSFPETPAVLLQRLDC
jgi:type II secretory pathway component PulK